MNARRAVWVEETLRLLGSPRRRWAAISLLFALTLALGGLFHIRPLLERQAVAAAARVQIANERRALEALSARIDRLSLRFDAPLRRFDRAPESAALHRALAAQAAGYGLETVSLRVQGAQTRSAKEGANGGDAKGVEAHIALRGDYPSLAGWIADLALLPTPIRLVALSIRPEQGQLLLELQLASAAQEDSAAANAPLPVQEALLPPIQIGAAPLRDPFAAPRRPGAVSASIHDAAPAGFSPSTGVAPLPVGTIVDRTRLWRLLRRADGSILSVESAPARDGAIDPDALLEE